MQVSCIHCPVTRAGHPIAEIQVADEDALRAAGWRVISANGISGWACVMCQTMEGFTTRIPIAAEHRAALEAERARRGAAYAPTTPLPHATTGVSGEAVPEAVAAFVRDGGRARAEALTASEDIIAQRFPRMRLVRRLGQGGMGSVFEGVLEDGTRVAVKVLSRKVRRHPSFAARFELEIEVLERLDHPGIARLLDHREEDGVMAFVMELVEGENLHETVWRGGLPIRRVAEIGQQLCEALAHAHARGVIHRDIKPGNVIVDQQGQAKLLDFGIAKLLTPDPEDFRLTETGQVVGTPKYIPPERYAGVRDVDARADVYSLGVLLFELAGGKLDDYGTKGVAPLPSVHPGLDEVLARAVATEPGERFSSAEAFGEALRRVAV